MYSLDPPRVFVGVDGSLASLRALRRAVHDARRSGGDVEVVYARRPAAAGEAGVRTRGLDARLDNQAERTVSSWVREALGALPADVPVHTRVVTGRPGPALTGLAWRDSDLIVVGAGRRVGRSVGRYCLAHATCPVLVVPPDSFARSVTRRPRSGGGLRRRDLWKQLEAADGHRRAG